MYMTYPKIFTIGYFQEIFSTSSGLTDGCHTEQVLEYPHLPYSNKLPSILLLITFSEPWLLLMRLSSANLPYLDSYVLTFPFHPNSRHQHRIVRWQRMPLSALSYTYHNILYFWNSFTIIFLTCVLSWLCVLVLIF